MADITVKQKEAKTLTFTVTQSNVALDISGADFQFAVKQTKADVAYLINKTDADFDDVNAANGIITLYLDEADLDLDAGEYIAELKIDMTPSSSAGEGGIDKSADLSMEVTKAVITD